MEANIVHFIQRSRACPTSDKYTIKALLTKHEMAHLENVKFDGRAIGNRIDLVGYDFSDITIKNSKFIRVNLENASFEKSQLEYIDLSNSNLESTNFNGAALREITLACVENFSVMRCKLYKAEVDFDSISFDPNGDEKNKAELIALKDMVLMWKKIEEMENLLGISSSEVDRTSLNFAV